MRWRFTRSGGKSGRMSSRRCWARSLPRWKASVSCVSGTEYGKTEVAAEVLTTWAMCSSSAPAAFASRSPSLSASPASSEKSVATRIFL